MHSGLLDVVANVVSPGGSRDYRTGRATDSGPPRIEPIDSTRFMRSFLRQFGPTLALGALALQVVVASLGGRLCVRADVAEAAVVAAPACGACCPAPDRSAPVCRPVVCAAIDVTTGAPLEDECCVRGTGLVATSSPRIADLDPGLDHLAMLIAPTFAATLAPPAPTAGTVAITRALPPPDAPLVRAAVLRL